MAFTNTSPSLVPTRAKKGTLGTNPITVAAAGNGEDQFVLDMATTSVARGKVEIQKVKGKPMPTGWAVDKDGHEITGPDKFYGLQPLGGTEECSGYKGYGLAMMVEIFCGMLSGSTYGPHVRGFKQHINPANLVSNYITIWYMFASRSLLVWHPYIIEKKGGDLQQHSAAAPTAKHPMQKHRADKHRETQKEQGTPTRIIET
ncbi:hypothetical protein FSP39_005686 [Pinctada imbricata]|uniref:Uncharacterized protein n=1 Tax=Pinctada imbricata TaxID=66713 RepID=A0AA89BU38_PINIB|nr:hypothetical protein FSP39_005686 [Pinctada imbricata]